MYYLIFTLLFLRPSIKTKYIPFQIIRGLTGFILSLLLFYLINFDRSLTLIISVLWLPAVFQITFCFIEYESLKEKGKNIVTMFLIYVSLLSFFTSIIFNMYPYITGKSNMLAKMVPVKESNEKLTEIDAAHVIVISPETAYYEMQKMLGVLPNPSVYKIGELGITKTKDGAVYVAPIEVDGLFRSLSNSEIPGVISVSAEGLSEAKIINVPSTVSDSLAFNHKLSRYLRQYKNSSVLFQANVELDDDNKPYYVGSYGHYKYGRKGPVVDGVLLVSFKDGTVTDYPADKVPEWVDEVYPSDISEKYNEYFGSLQNGLLNSFFSKTGVHIPTQWATDLNVPGVKVNSKEVTGVIDGDGKLKWFTDHTNTSNTSTTMTGYSLMDMRTGEMVYYKTSGYINGKGAVNAVDKALGANKASWSPVQPIFYNLFGTEGWVVPVVNKTDGALVKVAIVAAENGYTVLEDNKETAIQAFKNAIAYGKISSENNKNANSIKAEEKSLVGIVERINSVSENGNTVFYVKLVDNDKIFMVTQSTGINIVLTKETDTVEIKYLDIADTNIVSTTSFTNANIK